MRLSEESFLGCSSGPLTVVLGLPSMANLLIPSNCSHPPEAEGHDQVLDNIQWLCSKAHLL